MVGRANNLDADISVDCSLTPLPLGALMRVNAHIMLGWIGRRVIAFF